MAALDYLMKLREQGSIASQVWPQEGFRPDASKHVIVEGYPAIYSEPPDYGECRDEHCRDAWRVLQWMLGESNAGTLEGHFGMDPMPFGRVEDVSFEDQLSFEG